MRGEGREEARRLARAAFGTLGLAVGILHPTQQLEAGATALAAVFVEWHRLIPVSQIR